MKPLEFSTILQNFSSNMKAISVLASTIGVNADAFDDNAFDRAFSGVKDLLSNSAYTFFLGFFKQVIEEVQAGTKPLKLSELVKDSTDPVHLEISALMKSPEAGVRYQNLMASLSGPKIGDLLRRSAVVQLMSHWEWLISDLLSLFYQRTPNALPEEYKISLSQLRHVKSLEQAEILLVNSEIDSVLRKSLNDQLEYFVKKGHIKLEAIEPFRSSLTEVSQRRNCLVHNSGRYGSIYIEKVSPEIRTKYGVSEGDVIQTDPTYMADGVETVYAAGVTLIQTCWRKWDKASHQIADQMLLLTIRESVILKEYRLTCSLAQMRASIRFKSQLSERKVAVDYAIALSKLGNLDKAREVINGFDWSASSLYLKIAAHALLGESGELAKSLPIALQIGELDRFQLIESALFDNYRDEGWFKAMIPVKGE